MFPWVSYCPFLHSLNKSACFSFGISPVRTSPLRSSCHWLLLGLARPTGKWSIVTFTFLVAKIGLPHLAQCRMSASSFTHPDKPLGSTKPSSLGFSALAELSKCFSQRWRNSCVPLGEKLKAFSGFLAVWPGFTQKRDGFGFVVLGLGCLSHNLLCQTSSGKCHQF